MRERRTEQCSPRFRPGGRFWSQVSDTCRQAGREGEKCRPLDHTWQIPFIHPARLMIGSNSYIYNSSLVISSMWYVQVCVCRWCIFNGCACALAETLLFIVQSHYKSCVFPDGACWCILAQSDMTSTHVYSSIFYTGGPLRNPIKSKRPSSGIVIGAFWSIFDEK